MSAPYPKADANAGWDVVGDNFLEGYKPLTDHAINRAAFGAAHPKDWFPGDPMPKGPVPPEPPHGEWRDQMHTYHPNVVGVCCGDFDNCVATDCDSSKPNREARKAMLDGVQRKAEESAQQAAALREKFAPPANPKQAYGDTKVPLHLFPSTAVAVGSMCMADGRGKYGQDNFRAAPVEAMTYVRAAMSHLFLWSEGEDSTTDSLLPHLGHALASVAILIDAHYAGSLIDNRKFPGGYQRAIEDMQKHVQRIHDSHADKSPKHWTIEDAT